VLTAASVLSSLSFRILRHGGSELQMGGASERGGGKWRWRVCADVGYASALQTHNECARCE
jgi:hypothetical protein